MFLNLFSCVRNSNIFWYDCVFLLYIVHIYHEIFTLIVCQITIENQRMLIIIIIIGKYRRNNLFLRLTRGFRITIIPNGNLWFLVEECLAANPNVPGSNPQHAGAYSDCQKSLNKRERLGLRPYICSGTLCWKNYGDVDESVIFCIYILKNINTAGNLSIVLF